MQKPVTESAPAAELARIPELDGFRAFAILSVLVGHLLFVNVSPDRAFPAHVAAIFKVFGDHAFLGVDLFFVLSGFLITSILLRLKGRKGYFQRFYSRRILRIFPLYFIVLAILAVSYRGPGLLPGFAMCAAFVANFRDHFGIPTPNGAGPFWSLSVEEQFYFVWPWLVLWFDRRTLAYFAALLLALEPIVRLLSVNVPGAYVLPWCRFDGLAMGALLAVLYASPNFSRRRANTISLILLGALVLQIAVLAPFGVMHAGTLSFAFRINQAVLAFGALMTFAIANTGRVAVGFLRTSFLRATAELSYCMYLIHVPLSDLYDTLARSGAVPLFGLGSLAQVLIRATVIVVATYGLAAISRQVIELPFLRLKKVFG